MDYNTIHMYYDNCWGDKCTTIQLNSWLLVTMTTWRWGVLLRYSITFALQKIGYIGTLSIPTFSKLLMLYAMTVYQQAIITFVKWHARIIIQFTEYRNSIPITCYVMGCSLCLHALFSLGKILCMVLLSYFLVGVLTLYTKGPFKEKHIHNLLAKLPSSLVPVQ